LSSTAVMVKHDGPPQSAKQVHVLFMRDGKLQGVRAGHVVMACYNWDENRIREMLSTMPETPRQRNFWNLLGRHTLPDETYNYVFYIVSAAVIGENPRLFGFDFDDPLGTAPADTSRPGPEGGVPRVRTLDDYFSR